MPDQLPAFLGVAAVVICTPGPDTALTVRNALVGGRACGVATAAGVATGQAAWTLAVGLGVAELLQASEPAFLLMKTVGAAYLIVLGLQSLWSAARPGPTTLWTARSPSSPGGLRSPTGGPGSGPGGWDAPGSPGPAGGPGSGPRPGRWSRPGRRSRAGRWSRAGRRLGVGRAWGQGVVSNLANPKMAGFFLSLLPQFAAPGRGAWGVVGLGLVFCLMTFGWLGLYSVAVDRARVVLGRSRVWRALDGLAGCVLVGFGARLALERR